MNKFTPVCEKCPVDRITLKQSEKFSTKVYFFMFCGPIGRL